MLEKHFQQKVITVAQYYGWLVQHTRAVNSDGRWMTPISGDAGFPDLVLCHPRGRGLLFAELKADKGRLSDSQQIWLQALNEAGAESYVWRPKDIDAISTRLANKGKPT